MKFFSERSLIIIYNNMETPTVQARKKANRLQMSEEGEIKQ
jgi:hypothetical protein